MSLFLSKEKEGIPTKQFTLSAEEKAKRKTIAINARKMIASALENTSQDENSIMAHYRGFYLQITFSELHPLMVFCLARPLEDCIGCLKEQVNTLNLRSVLGSHFVNDTFSCYTYRATHWLDAELSQTRFFEILNRCCDEAIRGYDQVFNREECPA